MGRSVDWSLLYTTIGQRAQTVAQQAFIDGLSKGDAYRAHGPTLWDTTFRTAVAQAELQECLLIAVAQNIKKMALLLSKRGKGFVIRLIYQI